MGFDIGVTLSAQIPIDLDEFVNAVLTLSPLREFEHPTRGRVFAILDEEGFWTQEDIINEWDVENEGGFLSQKDSGLVIGFLYRNFYKASGAENIHPDELNLNKYKERMISMLRLFYEGRFAGFAVLSQQTPVEEVDDWPQISKDESVETRTKALVYFENLIQEVKKVTVWTMTVDMN